MAETLDRLSGGRLILGLGGGASDHEFRQFGLRVPTPAERTPSGTSCAPAAWTPCCCVRSARWAS